MIEQLKTTQAPIVLTVNGISELVVQSAEGYQQLLDRLEYLETVTGLLREQYVTGRLSVKNNSVQ